LKAEKAWDKDKAKLAADYGKIPAAEYMERAQHLSAGPEFGVETLREDYEIGIIDGVEFFVKYQARCTVCGFKFSFKHSQNIEAEDGK
jgi:hypothetical protein